MASKQLTQQALVDSFISLLDEALIIAVLGDFDLSDAAAYKQARSTLEALAQSVLSEEAAGFNASGLSHHAVPPERAAASTASSSRSTSGPGRPVTDGSSTDGSSSGLDSADAVPNLTLFEENSEEDKILVLRGMFSQLKASDIEFSLRRAKGDFRTALDDLLNVQYLESTGERPKGVDAFFTPESNGTSSGKRAKGKNSKRVGAAVADKEQNQSEIQYLAERFGTRSDQVAPIYYKAQCSKGATAAELLNQYISHGVETQDASGRAAAEALAKKYRQVPESFMPTIVHVTGTIPKFADDIAALLNKHFSKKPKWKKMGLTHRITSLPTTEIDGSPGSSGKVLSSVPGTPASPNPSSSCSLDLQAAVSRAATHDQARRHASAAANQMYRRGASNPLYRQAASFYSEQAREQASLAHGAKSTAANILVDQQSSRTSIDLHGVQVHDGVRIARQKVQQWWNDLGEMKAAKVREQGGFTIITGLGRHSAGGMSHLRRAVAANLLHDGWKMSVETGRFVITGRR